MKVMSVSRKEQGKHLLSRKSNNIYPGWYCYVYIMPAALLMLLMCLFPVLLLIYNSFTDLSLMKTTSKWIGFENYRYLFSINDQFITSLGRTFIYAFSTVFFQILFGFLFSLLFQMRFRAKRVIRSVMILPMVASPIAIAFLWTIMYNPSSGVINYILKQIGIPGQMWLSSGSTALASIIMVDVWQNTPFVYLVFSSAITALPHDPFDAAYVDGAGFFQMVRHVMLPMLRPVFMVVLLLRLVDGLKAFDLTYTLTAGGPVNATTTVNILIYKSAFQHYEMGMASATALIMYIVIFVIATFIVRRSDMSFR